MTSIPNQIKNDTNLYGEMQKSPLFFIEKVWGLTPELDNVKFVKGKHITFQQYEILKAVEDAVNGNGPKRVSISSGHGIGKTATLAWLILWYLFTHKDAQIPCTAPTSEQIHDVLWKELSLWLNRMPKEIQKFYEYTTGYLRIRERPDTWFARAKTARKENPEALAGVHGEFVMFIIDEASGVFDEIFNTAEGALTGQNVLVIMISNPTRLLGYFYDSHHKDKSWKTLQYSSLDSPLVDKEFIARISEKHGKDSDEYRIRVLGQFPKEDSIDEKGFVALLNESDLKFTNNTDFAGTRWLGVDPSGEGLNKTVWVLRDNFRAQVLGKEEISDSKGIAQKTLTLMRQYGVEDECTVIDNFGIGANVGTELAFAGVRATCTNVGEKANDDKTYLNKRAEYYWLLREWLKKGGELVGVDKWYELLSIRFRRELNGKIKIMGKDEMRKMGIESPDVADALMLTFAKKTNIFQNNYSDIAALENESRGEYGLD